LEGTGAYTFGRTGSRISIENGRKQVVRGFRKVRQEWEVLLVDHHEGYLSWGLSTCRQNDEFAAVAIRPLRLGCNTRSLTPYGHRFASEYPVIGRGDKMTAGVEGIVDGTVGREEPLG
jgi:hypothetical protein